MSRSIPISYRDGAAGAETIIEVQSPYDLLGTQDHSMAFWKIRG